jgi:hypothetical protein
MFVLAFVSIVKGRAIDRTLGDLTYPLYHRRDPHGAG